MLLQNLYKTVSEKRRLAETKIFGCSPRDRPRLKQSLEELKKMQNDARTTWQAARKIIPHDELEDIETKYISKIPPMDLDEFFEAITKKV